MLPPNKIVIEREAFHALISSKDINHFRAKSTYEYLLDWEWELWTTSFIIIEISTAIHRHAGPKALKVFTDIVLSSIFNIAWIDNTIYELALKRMLIGQIQLSLEDWITIVVAESLNAQVFTFNSVFNQEGILVFPR